MTEPRIRDATMEDAEALLAIYRPFVANTIVSFEVEAPSVAEFRQRIDHALERWAWIVAEQGGRPVGYAYGTAHRPRSAYQWSVETSVYVDDGHRGMGIGKRLYARLMPILADKGYCNAYAGITLPNEASIALHRSVGFVPVGVFRRVGHKFGAWHDVSWWHLPLREDPPPNP
ncbi:MAG: GNAT family N-acetyltransferase [Acidobacteria bacterium]|nr:MAG: GNAT family N-acetyltransferase [Acidobacteriota bacterium]